MKKIALFTLVVIFVFVFGFLSGSFWTTLRLSELPILEEIKDIQSEISFRNYSSETSFWESKYFGGMVGMRKSLKHLPKGEAVLRGRFLFKDHGVEGVKFRLTFNSKYESDSITTDNDGLFSLRIPAGKWYLNSIKCEAWQNMPEGSYMLISGDEQRLGTVSMQELFYDFMEAGKLVHVDGSDSADKYHIEIRISPRMSVQWPERHIPKQEATVATSEIRWSPYPDAQDYVVQISRVTRKSPNSSSYSSIVHKRVSGREVLPLSALESLKEPTASPEEYSVAIRAYGKQGEFLGASEHFLGTFELTDGHVLVEGEDDTSAIHGEEALRKLYRNTKRYQAVELLIQEGMLPEAERLLEQLEIVSPEFVGKKYLLEGYLAASRGKCEVAAKAFESAEKEGQDCVPEEYRADCK